MKNLFIAAGLLLSLLFANDVKAQVIGKDIKTNNEFSLTYGTLSNSEWIEAFGWKKKLTLFPCEKFNLNDNSKNRSKHNWNQIWKACSSVVLM